MSFLAILLAVTLAGSAPPPVAPDTGICVPQLQLTNPAECPALGPGNYAVHYVQAQVPAVIPKLPLAQLTRYDPVVDYTYARVTTPNAPLFASPVDGAAGKAAGNIGKGLIFVNLVTEAAANGQSFYQIRTGQFIRTTDVSTVTVTDFQGLLFNDQPQYHIGWVVNNVRPSFRPGVPPPTSGQHLWRRTVVQIFATQHVGQWDWYLVGPNQWLEQRVVARLNLNPPPPGVTGRWIQVDLYEQTLAAYDGNRLVYATLISSGLDERPTRPGLFHI
jgi:hypothetical protein